MYYVMGVNSIVNAECGEKWQSPALTVMIIQQHVMIIQQHIMIITETVYANVINYFPLLTYLNDESMTVRSLHNLRNLRDIYTSSTC